MIDILVVCCFLVVLAARHEVDNLAANEEHQVSIILASSTTYIPSVSFGIYIFIKQDILVNFLLIVKASMFSRALASFVVHLKCVLHLPRRL